MKELTLQVPDTKYSFFVELLKSLKFVKQVNGMVATSPSKEEYLKGLRGAVSEMNLIKAKKKKAVPFNEFMNEL